MQGLSSTQKSGLMLDEPLSTGESGGEVTYKFKSLDEKVFTLAPINNPSMEEQDDGLMASRINVNAQTVFTIASDPSPHGKIYITGGITILAVTVVVIFMFYFKYAASSAVAVTPSAVIPVTAADDIIRQINNVAVVHTDVNTDLPPTVISATEMEGSIEKSVEQTGVPGQTDDGITGVREQWSSSTGAHSFSAKTLPMSNSDLSSPVTTTTIEIASDPGAAVIVDFATEYDTEEKIHIIRKRVPNRIGILIHAAYAAYVAGNISDARQTYQAVLQNVPDQRDALLGMAAIALRTGEKDEAARIWLQVLAGYPDDPVATTALIDLMASENYKDNARVVEKLLQTIPHAAFLHFSLGNLQAAASRWPEARRAFAEACSLESNNPEYAYNLAVSLEHTGDSKSAIDQYQIALKLAQEQTVYFDSSEVKSRITLLAETFHER